MELSMTRNIDITLNMLDAENNVKPSAILDAVQFISNEHSKGLHCAYDDLIVKNHIWVIVKNEIHFFKEIKAPVFLTFVTYPLKRRLFEYPRDTEIYQKGELVALVRTIWMVFDLNTKNVVAESFYSDLELRKPMIETRISRIQSFPLEELKHEKDVEVVFSQIDHNRHLNNTRYVDLFYDVFTDKYKLKTMNIEYLKQVYLGEKISLFSHIFENYVYFYGYVNGEKCFAIRGEIEHEN